MIIVSGGPDRKVLSRRFADGRDRGEATIGEILRDPGAFEDQATPTCSSGPSSRPWEAPEAAHRTSTARATLVAIAQDPEDHYGDAVTVGGEVARVRKRVFVLEAEGRELLIVPEPERRQALREGAAARVTGIVTPVDSDRSDRVLDEPDIIEQYDGRASVTATTVAVFGR